MRLHRLEVQAFGPYAGREEVDFDQLNDAGVFLLTGPTGAGKTSVLDAVCFALYGVVPGEREVRSLRSAHAEPELATRVVVELTLGDRRLRVERWPSWERPKKRGRGMTSEPAGARLLELLPDGAETLISSRAQEVGHELGPLLAMTSEQFMQVVLLPQGGFASFLQATSEQRRDLLEQLFATQRFARIEGWVHDRASRLRSRSHDHREQVGRVLAALAHRAQREAPPELDEELLGRWRQAVLDDAAHRVSQASVAEQASAAELETQQESAGRLAQVVAAATRRAAAVAELASLEQSGHEADAALERLRAHRRAASVAPLALTLVDAEEREAAASAAVAAATAQLPEPDRAEPGVDLEGWRSRRSAAERQVGALSGVHDSVRRLHEAKARLRSLAADHLAAASAVQETEQQQRSVPERTRAVERRLAAAQLLAVRCDDLRAARRDAASVAEAAALLEPARAALLDAQGRSVELSTRLNDVRSRHLDLVERRLSGMAAELAGSLEPGSACVVCGSTEHPAPAAAAADAVTVAEQQAAEEAVESAAEAAGQAQVEVDRCRAVVDPLVAVAGDLDARAAQQALLAASVRLSEATDAAAEEQQLRAELADLERERQTLAQRVERSRAEAESLRARLDEVGQVVAELEPRVRAVLGDQPLERAEQDAQRRVAGLTTAVRALEDLEQAQAHRGRAAARAAVAATAADFPDLAGAVEARLDEAQETALEQVLAERARRRSRAEDALAAPEVVALAELDQVPSPGDLASAEVAVREAAEAHRRCGSALDSARDLQQAVHGLDRELEQELARWRPVRDEHALVDSMATLVRGTSADNQLQVRLSSYVLMTQLDLVLEAANERLRHMRDNRYTLHRADRAALRGARARSRTGLDLEVMDEWTGQQRSPSTLSGGETFKVSLALALGLADVITHEAGGLDIDTLFIDEGFGMLDPDTLDEVMDCIDDLRGGGRSVGVVSHVTELTSRIGTQLHVEPSRTGSRVRVRTTAV